MSVLKILSTVVRMINELTPIKLIYYNFNRIVALFPTTYKTQILTLQNTVFGLLLISMN